MSAPAEPAAPAPSGGDAPGWDPAGRVEVLDRLLASSSDLVVVVDRSGRLRYVSAASHRILGRDPAHWVGKDVFELIHPDDVGLAAEAMVTSAEGDVGIKDPLVLRVLHADGRWRHVEIVANNLPDDPFVDGLLINARDLTDRVRAQESAERDRRRFEQVFERAPIGMALVSADARLMRANGALSTMVGRPVHELLAVDLLELVDPRDRLRGGRHGRDVLGGRTVDPIEVRLLRPDGALRWARVTATVVRDDDGRAEHAIAHVEDVTEQRLLREELEHRVRHDALTDALNREGFRRHAARLADRRLPAGVVVVDLDGFKAVNDSLGHGAGDELLVAVAARLRHAVKAGDAVARFGGDEFVVLTWPVDARQLAAIAERVRTLLAQPFVLAAGRATVTGSVGTALAAPGTSIDDALTAADADVYRAKRSGGDAVGNGRERAGDRGRGAGGDGR